MSFTPNIQVFSCHYTSQQSCADSGKELQNLDFPENVRLNRVPCTGKLQEVTLLKAFEEGADGVYVAGCLEGDCHFKNGNIKAARRVKYVKQLLDEIGIGRDRLDSERSEEL